MSKQRRVQPADPGSSPVAQFGFDLRTLRQGAELSYARIAEISHYSRSAVHAVDQGHQLPSEQLLAAFVRACNGIPEEWLRRRAEIHAMLAVEKRAVRKESPKQAGMAPPDLTHVGSKVEYNDALKKLREWSGMSFKQIGQISQNYPRPAPASTLCTALQRGTLPARSLTESFLQAVGLDEVQRSAWLKVWDDLHAGRPVHPDSGRRRRRSIGHRPRTADVTPVMPALPYPTSEVREWVLVNGEWRAADENGVITDKPWYRLAVPVTGSAALLMALLATLWLVYGG